MKFLNTLFSKRLAMLLVLPAFVLAMTTSCGDDAVVVIPVEDGTYFFGSATGGTTLSNDFTLQAGRVEGDGFSSNLRTGMAEGFGYFTAGELFVVTKAGTVETTWGSAAGTQTSFALNGENSQIVGTVGTGTAAVGGEAVNIASSGFYHFTIDQTTMTYHFYKIGDMQFTNGFQTLAQTSANASGASWMGTNIRIEGNFKFRWNEGWKVIVEDGPTQDDDYIFFANFGKGTTATDIVAGGPEWGIADLPGGAGLYTVKVDWVPGDGWALTFTRTADIPATDLSGESLEIIGAGAKSGGVVVGWTDGQLGQLPTQAGSLYSWTYTGISFDQTMGFKFRTTATWDGTFNIGCDFATYDGPDAGDVSCIGGAGSDLQGTDGSDYTLVVTIDGNNVAGGKTLTITKE